MEKNISTDEIEGTHYKDEDLESLSGTSLELPEKIANSIEDIKDNGVRQKAAYCFSSHSEPCHPSRTGRNHKDHIRVFQQSYKGDGHVYCET